MANAKPKKRAMRSRRSGVKKKKLVDANLAILKKLSLIVILASLFSSCVMIVPVRRHHPKVFGRTMMHPRHFEESRQAPFKWR